MEQHLPSSYSVTRTTSKYNSAQREHRESKKYVLNSAELFSENTDLF
jgi:hypothetical protein